MSIFQRAVPAAGDVGDLDVVGGRVGQINPDLPPLTIWEFDLHPASEGYAKGLGLPRV